MRTAVEKGAHIVTGGEREEISPSHPAGPRDHEYGYRMGRALRPGALPVIRVKSVEEAIEIANQSEYGLQSSVFTNNLNKAFAIAGQLEVGTVQINNKPERGPDNFPS